LGHEEGVQLRRVDLLDVHLDILAGHLGEVPLDAVHLRAPAADDDSRTGGEDVHLDPFGSALDLHPGYGRPLHVFPDVAPYGQVLLEEVGVIPGGEPAGLPVIDDP
jgi:hypothetical protein